MSLLDAIVYAASDPSMDVVKVERLIGLHRDMEAQAAERAFNDALAAAQAEMAPVSKDAANDQTRSRYATLAALDRALRPIYSTRGFAVTFDSEPAPVEQTVRVVAYLTGHGHTRRYQLDMPADGKGAKGGDVMTRTHATASAITYGRRYLLCMAFNISTEDDDGNAAGQRPKSAYQARRENDYPRIEKAIRQAQTFEELHRIWEDEKAVIRGWPSRWRDHIVETKEVRKAQLGGTNAMLHASLAYLDGEGRP
jgi:hypothetical protein